MEYNMKQKKWYAVLLAILSAVVLCFAVGCGEKSHEEVCGEYAIKLIEDNDFYNPSSVRVLKAYYEDSEGNATIKSKECEAIVYCQIQAGTKSGGTTTARYAIIIGGEDDGTPMSCSESDFTGDALDVSVINNMIKKHWEDLGVL